MKVRHMIVVLLVFAWPLYYLYQLQLGAVSFLLLAIFFLVVSIKEMKKHNRQLENQEPSEKIKRNSR
jgi:Ca2+/Na+ antiporter